MALTWLNMVAVKLELYDSKCVYLSTLDRRRSTTMEPRMNEEARKATTAVQGARDDPGSRESSQLTGDSCDLNLARSRKKEGSGERPGKKSRGNHRGDRADRNPSVCRPRPEIKTPWIIHRRDRTRGPTTGRLPARLPLSLMMPMPKANLRDRAFDDYPEWKKFEEAHNRISRSNKNNYWKISLSTAFLKQLSLMKYDNIYFFINQSRSS